jgi:hypothetical protein
MTKGEISFQAYGYHLDAIKPVHLANGFFLALTGKHYRLEWINKLAVVTHKKGLHGDYETANLQKILVEEKAAISSSFSDECLSSLRFQANAILSNDQAVYAAFDEYSAFGNDYTISSPEFLCDHKRKDGYAGFFIYSVFSVSETGREILNIAKDEFEKDGDSLCQLFKPLLDDPSNQVEWDNRVEEKLGTHTEDRLKEIAEIMRTSTEGILRLIKLSRNIESRYSFLRQLVTALGAWLTLYLIREASAAADLTDPALLFCDFTGNKSKKCRTKSVNCFSRHREMIYRSFQTWEGTGKISNLDAYKDTKGRVDLKDVERHFQDLTVRIGLAQPRAATVRSKHYEPQADTIRTLATSLMDINEGPITFQELAEKLRSTWGLVFGGCDDDASRLADQGIIGLDEDDDLSLNRRYFIEQLKSLGLAFEPSDGLVLCEVGIGG